MRLIGSAAVIGDFVWSGSNGVGRVAVFEHRPVVGLGGANPESRTRQFTRTLPLRPADVTQLEQFLRTYCELSPASAAPVLSATRALCEAFHDGPLETYTIVEINPLIAGEAAAVAADVVITR